MGVVGRTGRRGFGGAVSGWLGRQGFLVSAQVAVQDCHQGANLVIDRRVLIRLVLMILPSLEHGPSFDERLVKPLGTLTSSVSREKVDEILLGRNMRRDMQGCNWILTAFGMTDSRAPKAA